MPLYQYECNECGKRSEHWHNSQHIPDVVSCPLCSTGNATRRYGAAVQNPACWPMASESMAVHPSQIGEAAAQARRMGVPTEFDKAGRPLLTSARHRKQYAEAHGFYDRNGGYGDPQKR